MATKWQLIDSLCLLPSAAAVLNAETGEILDLTSELFELLGFAAYDCGPEITPEEWFSSLFQNESEHYEQFFGNLGINKKVRETFVLQGRDTQVHVIINAVRVKTDDEFTLDILTFIDLNERTLGIKQRLNDREYLYRSLHENIVCGITLYERTVDGYNIVDSNATALKILGEDHTPEYYKTNVCYLRDFIYPEDFEMIKTGFDNLQYIGDSFHFTHRMKNVKTGAMVWVSGVSNVIRMSDGKNYIQSTFIDTTNQARLEQTRRDLEMKKEDIKRMTERNNMKNVFIENMSHSIKTPLNSIVGYAMIAKTSPERIPEAMDNILLSSRYLLDVINTVLDMTLIEEKRIKLDRTHFRIIDFFEGIRNEVQPLIDDKNQNFTLVYNNITHPKVIGDSIRLAPIFSNILHNAVRYTKRGGEITMTVTEVMAKSGLTTFSVVVSDNGEGMNKQTLEQIFDPFFTVINTKRTTAGLGLPLAKQLLNMAGGTIRIESTPGAGTNVFVTIDFETAGGVEYYPNGFNPNSYAKPKPHEEYSFIGKNVLIVEDNLFNREIFEELLIHEGAEVETAATGEEAVDIVDNSAIGHFNIIFMDIDLPKMSGIEASKKIRELFRPDVRTVPIIALTANSFTDDIAVGMSQGMDAYEPKPVDISRIKNVLSLLDV
ncbi:MAG: response regulator [Ruminococcus sp.]|jgi:signal transduction histidine kinase/ActR/RegA family two-component response regulator|nr:response regulator [Ruminococcus sp.]